MRDRSRLMPPRTGVTCPSSDVPAPNGTTGTPCWWQMASTRPASSDVSMNATASGMAGGWVSSTMAVVLAQAGVERQPLTEQVAE